jgi:hypothetical protein
MDGTVARIRYCRGAREAIATIVKVTVICTSNIKAEELDSPLAGVRVYTNGGGSNGGKHHQQQEGVRQEQQGQWRG